MQHQDGVEQVWRNFFALRTQKLDARFRGRYRAVVVETNDPLQMHRLRVRIPELHNADVESKLLPWASMSAWFGGSGCGSWISATIGDEVWVEFEKGHPYNIVVVGFANPTRRKFYVLESTYCKSPLSVDKSGKPADRPQDYQEAYLPKDNRPMNLGWRDRYGSFVVLDSVGFFPKEHDVAPSPTGQDAIAKGEFDASKAKPQNNQPDTKHVVICSKYGHFILLGDTGYQWKLEGSSGEFEGDFDKDRQFEIDRSFFLQKLFNEDKPSGRDQRRFEVRTRYGHKLELRDVGWSKTRPGEYSGDRKDIGSGSKDERWCKVRSKGGHLFQMWDYGCDPIEDVYVKRSLLEEIGGATEVDQEDQWQGRGDARQIRLVSRYGFKIVIDDRGSDKLNATAKEKPRGNGVLIKGRRDQRGFGLEFNEKDPLNALKLYTPKSKALEFNDKHDFVILCTDTREPLSEPWRNLYDNEFALASAMTYDPERDTHHLKLDKHNGYVRLVTKKQQGIEMRDGDVGKAWVEMRDMDNRGLWLSQDSKRSVLRSPQGKSLYIVLDDKANNVIVHNGDDGKIQIYCSGDVEIKSDAALRLHGKSVSIKSDSQISFDGGGGKMVLNGSLFGTDVRAHHPAVITPSAQRGTAAPITIMDPGVVSPLPFDEDRGLCDNKPVQKVDRQVIWS